MQLSPQSSQLQEVAVKAIVASQLGMEASREQAALLRRHDPPVIQRRQHGHLSPWRFQERRADKH